MNLQEARAMYVAHKALHIDNGAIALDSVRSYITPEMKRNFQLALDAQPALGTDPNTGVPSWLTTLIDPEVYEWVFAPLEATNIFGERKKGSWLDQTAMFPVAEFTGESSSYGDFSENGSTGLNTNFPQRQSYLFQTMKQYGELEMERAGLARISWVSELDRSATNTLNRFMNLSYFFGVAGLVNYGLLNDPNLSAPLAPAAKASSAGNRWINGGVITATANEIFLDIQSLVIQLVNQSAGYINQNSKMTLAMSPQSQQALSATNAFAVNVNDLIKKNYPNMEIKIAVQYGQTSATNPQGVAAGNMVQLLASEIQGMDVGYCSFNEKYRAHKIIPLTSSYKQKVTSGTWGAIIRMPLGIAGMVGV